LGAVQSFLVFKGTDLLPLLLPEDAEEGDGFFLEADLTEFVFVAEEELVLLLLLLLLEEEEGEGVR
jgi:hypothetical protein